MIPYFKWVDNYRYVFFQQIRDNDLMAKVQTWVDVSIEQLEKILTQQLYDYEAKKYVILANRKMEPKIRGKIRNINFAFTYADYILYDKETKVGEIWVVDFRTLMPVLKLSVKIEEESTEKVIAEIEVPKDSTVQLVQGIGKIELKVKKESD